MHDSKMHEDYEDYEDKDKKKDRKRKALIIISIGGKEPKDKMKYKKKGNPHNSDYKKSMKGGY